MAPRAACRSPGLLAKYAWGDGCVLGGAPATAIFCSSQHGKRASVVAMLAQSVAGLRSSQLTSVPLSFVADETAKPMTYV